MTHRLLQLPQSRCLVEYAKASLTQDVVVFVKKSEITKWVQEAQAIHPPVEVDSHAVRYHSKYWLRFRAFPGKKMNWTTLRPPGFNHVITGVCPIILRDSLPKVFEVWELCFKPLEEPKNITITPAQNEYPPPFAQGQWPLDT